MTTATPGREELAELLQSMPGEIELAGIIHDTADAGTPEEYCSWTMANRAAEAVAKRLATVRLAAKPADEGVRELLLAVEPFAEIAPLVEFTPHRDGERVHEQQDPATGRWRSLKREDFRRLKRAYDALSTKGEPKS